MEMIVLSYANILCIYPKLCLQVRWASWLRTYFTNQYVILRYCSPNLCKQNYLYGDLPFFKIQVNHFMAQDEPFGAKIIPKCILWVRGLVPFWVLRHSFLSLTEWNGNPLQYSFLENPRDRGAWWAAVYGVAQSRTRLERLISSSSSSDYITSSWRLAVGYSFCTLLMPMSEAFSISFLF